MPRRADEEASRAAAANEQDAGLGAVDVDQLGEGADFVELHRLARGDTRLAAGAQGDDAEGRLLAQAARHQVEVARLEDLQLEQAVGKQDGAQRKERLLGHAVPRRWAATERRRARDGARVPARPR